MNETTRLNQISHSVIGAAIEVHRAVGPGLFEPAYQECMYRELAVREIQFAREKPLPLEYQGLILPCGYRLDLLVSGAVVVELKSIELIAPIHEAQLLTYMRVGGWKLGLLINFNVEVLKQGIRRKVLGLRE